MSLKIIGNMTGNSMDAIDLVLTEFDGNKIKDICSYSKPYDQAMQKKMEDLRHQAKGLSKKEIEKLPGFQALHDEYIRQIADCINDMCQQNKIDKDSIDAIGFHGKTLDHNPPSQAKRVGNLPYTVQMGSGQMLADLTGIKVVYDFRSLPLMLGFEGAPLVPPHNAHISAAQGDCIYYNGGNTANFAIISKGSVKIGSDAGPFNEYTDNFVRRHTDLPYDENANFGKAGKLDMQMLQKLFDFGRDFYEQALPKSGDPAYYHKDEIFQYVESKNIPFNDAVHTFEYFAGYIAAHALSLIPQEIELPGKIVLFGGGWKNPVSRKSFTDLLSGKGEVLSEHQKQFAVLKQRFQEDPSICTSEFENFMEARLMADLARYKLEDKTWELPEFINSGKKIVCGIIACPQPDRHVYNDCINTAAKGWEQEQKGF